MMLRSAIFLLVATSFGHALSRDYISPEKISNCSCQENGKNGTRLYTAGIACTKQSAYDNEDGGTCRYMMELGYEQNFLIKPSKDLHDTLIKPKKTKVCQPGTRYLAGCNSCECSSDGTEVICSRNLCHPAALMKNEAFKLAQETAKNSLYEAKSDVPICEPNSEFEVDCNVCRCSSNGLKMTCTDKMCPSGGRRVARSPKPWEGCTPNTTFENECNSCRCTAKGDYICREKKCKHNQSSWGRTTRDTSKSASIRDDFICIPNSVLQKNCLHCMCSSSGVSFSCISGSCVYGS